ncbi:MAG: hypothetical protein CMM76_17485 [Rhodospirillaceae bacterium]|nr:hypothetical protein [Rhodospirillaceae bacterium]|tara:strand:+ start:1029 stop:1907 length:879 start_codon:yes stop_codon:yes gene_type:complete
MPYVKLPQYMISNLKRGLALRDGGIQASAPHTIATAREGVKTGQWSIHKINKARSFYKRMLPARKKAGARFTKKPYSKLYVAYLLWGDSGDGRAIKWLERNATNIRQNSAPARSAAQRVKTRRNAPKREKSRSVKKNAARRPQWMWIGSRIDMLIDTGEGMRLIQLRDDWVLCTSPPLGRRKGSTIFFCKVKRGRVNKNPSRAASEAFEQFTWGSPVDDIRAGSRPMDGPWKSVGKIKKIYYDGRLAETQDGPSRRVHTFKNELPVLQSSSSGPRVSRSGSKYYVSDRGIIG